jgi:hypothetical protein
MTLCARTYIPRKWTNVKQILGAFTDHLLTDLSLAIIGARNLSRTEFWNIYVNGKYPFWRKVLTHSSAGNTFHQHEIHLRDIHTDAKKGRQAAFLQIHKFIDTVGKLSEKILPGTV